MAQLVEHGWRAVKLYFMIGLPTETDDDIHAIFQLCRKVAAAAKARGVRIQVTAAVSPFTPKPHTPFQWEPQISLDEVHRRLALLRSLFRQDKRLALKHHMPEMSWLEGVFSRGDRALADVVEQAFRKGALFASWTDQLDLAPWRAALVEAEINPEIYLGPRDPEAPLPWDHLAVGVSRRFLLAERQRAFKGLATPDCRFGECRGCGACNIDGRASELRVQAEVMAIRPVLNRPARDQDAPPPFAEPPSALAPDASSGESPGASPARLQGKPQPEPRPELGVKAQRLRLWWAKLGPAAWLSQRELQGVFERAFRRARLPLSFSQGFHPLPLVSFGRALPVGVESEAEYLDLFLRRPFVGQAVLQLLDGTLPEGIEPLRAEPLPLTGKTPQSMAEEYAIRIDGPDAEAALQAWRELDASSSRPWVRETKKGPRAIDLRPLAARIEFPGPGEVQVLLDWREDYVNPLALAQEVMGLGPERFAMRKTRHVFDSRELG